MNTHSNSDHHTNFDGFIEKCCFPVVIGVNTIFLLSLFYLYLANT